MENQKITVLTSIRTKMVLAMVAWAIIAGVVAVWVLLPTAKSEVDTTTKNYMKDLAKAYGSMLDDEIAKEGVDKILAGDNLANMMSDVKVEGLDSSYLYVVDAMGTMLYHPTADKIGKPVENDAVKKTVEKIAKGEKVENEVIQYLFKGQQKYAGVFVNDAQDFIVVVTADYDEVFTNIRKIEKRVWVLFVLVLVLVLSIGSITAYSIVKPFNRLAELTMRSAEMDFTENEIQTKLAGRKDEIGRMARSMNYLIESLKNVVISIRDKSTQVMDAAQILDSDASETATTMEQVEQAVNDIAEGATSQAGETQRAEEQVVEMGNLVQETDEEVDKLLSFAHDMRECTSRASEILRALEAVNARAEEHIDIIAEQTDTTNAAALKISEATHLITSIAEETNLLALNASIEAARAGEQGKGFGVVASEIQKLAEQTNESATHIEEIVQELLRDAEKAVETMYGVREIMHTQSDHVEQTESAFEQVQSGVEQSIEGINHISERTSKLNEVRENVVGIVRDLTTIAEANAAGTEETSASATEVGAIMEDITGKSAIMRQAAKELEEGMNIFKF